MKITLNELRQIISANLLTEALNFEGLVTQKPPFYQAFYEKIINIFMSFKQKIEKNSILAEMKKRKFQNREEINSFFSSEYKDKEFNDKFEMGYIQYMLICVIEKGMSYEPISINSNTDTTYDTLKFNIDNPTNGIKGKYTEFIVKILSSNLFNNVFNADVSDEAEIVKTFQLLNNFINICNKSGSNEYKLKMQFFDTQVMPFLVKKQEEGKIRNVPKVSPQSPLQDKVARVFDDFGDVNGKNLIQVIIGEYLEKEIFETKSFAGYDVKLIDFCLQHNYWIEMDIPNNPSSIRTFYLNNGNFEMFSQKMNFDEFKDKWYSVQDLDEVEKYAQDNNMYFSGYQSDIMFSDWKNYLQGQPCFNGINLDTSGDYNNNVNLNFAYQGMVYACNIYPSKRPYNVSKSVLKDNSHISFFKSIKDDDYLVSENNEEFKIRESTDWCTKDFENFSWYINGVQDSIYGFILILNDSLPYNHPDGAILAGLKVDEKERKNNNQKIKYKVVNILNAKDRRCQLPPAINSFFLQLNKQPTRSSYFQMDDIEQEKQIDVTDLVDSYKQKYKKLNNLDYPRDSFKSSQDSHRFLQNQFNKKDELSEASMGLLKTYLKYKILR